MAAAAVVLGVIPALFLKERPLSATAEKPLPLIKSLTVQTTETLLALRLGYIVVIGIALGLSALCIWFYQLTHLQAAKIRLQLDERAKSVQV
jgi:Na+/melibiose symporter-like transporter